ncbi:diphthine synthase [archaeon]|nr:diphthine synthase [archaeon]
MLYMIGIGLSEKDITLGALGAVKECSEIFLEKYTSVGCSTTVLNKIFNKEITEADREFVESDELINKAKDNNVALLIYGDVFSATTHISLFLEAKKQNVDVEILNSSSILTAIGKIGLSLYNFGKTVSISFTESDVAYENFKINYENGMHTLVLLDLDPKNNKFLDVKHGIEYFRSKGLENGKIIGISQLNMNNEKIKYGDFEMLEKEDWKEFPQALIIPGKLHFLEEEALERWK